MQAIIRSEVDKTLDMKKLRLIVPEYCRVRRYDELKGKTLKDVMGRATVMIILWNIHDKKHRTLNAPPHDHLHPIPRVVAFYLPYVMV